MLKKNNLSLFLINIINYSIQSDQELSRNSRCNAVFLLSSLLLSPPLLSSPQ